jgi:hypothetical protein
MRRTFVVILAAAAACVTVALAGSASASPQIICPLDRHGPMIIPCCGPPVAQQSRVDVMPICCPINAPLCATGLSIGVSPNPSTAPDKVVISGRLIGGTGPIVVWERRAGQRKFHRLLQRTPDSTGQYSATIAPTTNRQFYASANGMRSVTVQEQVQAKVTLSQATRRNGSVTFIARVAPGHARERVMFEQRLGVGWHLVIRPRLDKHSTLRITLGAHVAMTFRIVLPADSRNVRSVSPTVSVH